MRVGIVPGTRFSYILRSVQIMSCRNMTRESPKEVSYGSMSPALSVHIGMFRDNVNDFESRVAMAAGERESFLSTASDHVAQNRSGPNGLGTRDCRERERERDQTTTTPQFKQCSTF